MAGIRSTVLFASALLCLQFASLPALAQDSALKPNKEEGVANALGAKRDEMAALENKAKSVALSLGELASSGKLPTNEEAIELMKKLVAEMQDVNQQLQQIRSDIADIQSWIFDQSSENLPIMQNDIAELKKAKIGNYLHFQLFDSDQNSSNEGFSVRRFRIGQTNAIDPRTSMKLTFDVAAGSQRLSAELKDAFVMYDIEPSVEKVGIQLLAGQQPYPLGYELERSSGEREFPERALYNRTMFAGERGRGAYVKYGTSANSHVHAGIWNALSVSDPQQTGANTFGNLGNSRYGAHAGLRWYSTQYDIGVSGYFSKRRGFSFTSNNQQTTVPSVDRRFIFIDGAYVGVLVPELTLRGEVMIGKDRVPTGGTANPSFLAATDVLGWQTQLTWNINPRNQLSARYEYFDPNRSSTSVLDATRGWGMAYAYYINPNAKITLAHEKFDEQGPEIKNDATTMRIQFRL